MQNHPPVPVGLYPGLPQNVIEHHEVQQAWQAHQSHFQSFVGAQAPPLQGPVFFNPGPQMPQPAPQERRDFNAELMDGFRNAYNERQRNQQQWHNAQAEILVPAPVL